jgi:hypothetical protein
METLAVRPGKIDWKSLLARRARRDSGALGRMIENRETVSGLVVSIGLHCERNGPVPERILNFMQSLGSAGDICGWSGADEFLLISPAERGASAQRRLARISRELWDFQLGSLGDFAILFSWGGVEAENEPIEDAIALAGMRMQETRRARKAFLGEIRAASACPVARPS